ncbi:MAG: M42 family metallopeptidase [Candidatus Bathyarchaeota archaeon]|nr:MAG: M42 family metallopeptidase [Candidatus Bathyarchaeota archaeon]
MFDEAAIGLLKDLCESFGPSGFERETARIVKSHVTGFSDKVFSDKLGSIIFQRLGDAERPRVLIAGHIDEVGFVVAGIEKKTGFLKFSSLGGWWDQVLLTQRVTIRTRKGDLFGVIAAKPPHLLSEEERNKVVSQDAMFIDVGVSSKEEAEALGVRIGDPVVPWSPFSLIGNGEIAVGKAFDDRIGAFVAMQTIAALKKSKTVHPNSVFGAATVQEEVGLRGATTVSHVVDPDVAIIVEVDISGDLPGIKPHDVPAKMGNGPSILTFDRSMIPNQPLKDFAIRMAEANNIPYQLSSISRGGTDAGRVHLNRAGCPSIVIGVPTRHIHSHVGMLSLTDTENTVNLVTAMVQQLDSETVKRFSAI